MFQDTFDQLSGLVGAPPDYVKLILLLIISSPLAYPLPLLPATSKHAVCLGVSAFFFLGILDLYLGFAQLLGTSLITYALTYFKIGGKRMPWIVFWVEMGHLTINHLVRAFGNIPLTTIEITAMQMVLTMNLTTFAWDIYDGQMRSEDECDTQQKASRITTMPSLLEFLGYAFYFPGVLVGPSTRFVDYRAWSNGTLYASPKGKEKEPAQQPPPGRFRAAAKDFLIGIFFLGIFAAVAPQWDFSALVVPASAGGINQYSFLWRVWFAVVASFMARTKYYALWNLTNAACILSGLSYNGLAPIETNATSEIATRTKWNRCQNVDILGVELAQNWKELLDHWNMNTNVWLRNNVYKRVAKPGRKPGFKSTMLTFLTSAFWHGIAPGYYVAFVYGGFCQSVARSLRRSLRPRLFNDPKASSDLKASTLGSFTISQLFYIFLSIASLHLSLLFAAIAFVLLDVKTILTAWASLYFYGIWTVTGTIIAFRLGAGKYLEGSKKLIKDKKIRKHLPEPTDAESKQRFEADVKREMQRQPGMQLPDVDLAERELRRRAGEVIKSDDEWSS